MYITHPIVPRAHGKADPVPIILEDVVVHVQVEGLKHRQAGITIVVDVIARHDSVIGAAVQEKPRVESVIDVVVRYVHMVTTFRSDDAVVAWRQR